MGNALMARYVRWRDWPLAAKGAAIIALPIALLLATMYSSYLSQQEISRADIEVQRTLAIQADIQALHTLIAEAASGVRGFLLTGREEFLSPYFMAQARLPDTLTLLRSSMQDPLQSQRLVAASQLVTAKLESLNTLRVRGAQFEREALQSHLTHSKKILDELRQQISLLGARETELLAARNDDAFRARQRDVWLSLATSAAAVGGAVFALWMLLTGIIRRVQQVAANAERLAQGAPLNPAPIARDEVGRLAERLQAASVLLAERAEQAQAASRAKTEFLSRTSHELRTPLNAILGFAQLLEVDLKNSSHASSVMQVLSAGRHLLTLIDDVLDIARIEAGQIKLALAPVAILPLLSEVHTLISPLAAQHNVRVQLPNAQKNSEAHASDSAIALSLLNVQADQQRLRQVLLNVLSNAVKYNRPNGDVRMTLEATQTHVQVAIHDNGVGMQSDKLQRLFEPFERLDAERIGVEGTGLGLAISRQLMERMHGHIQVQSELGQGSVFTLTLVRAQGALPVQAQGAQVREISGNAPSTLRRLLCVEDNASNLSLVQAILARRKNWQLLTATTGGEALAIALAEKPDLILLDLHLPDISGEVLLTRLRQEPSFATHSIVVLSADALPSTIARLLAAGASDYWTKPLDVVKMFTLLDKHELLERIS
jgi:signal transduction histidine kinase/ActR/RegA family two-component response regulator